MKTSKREHEQAQEFIRLLTIIHSSKLVNVTNLQEAYKQIETIERDMPEGEFERRVNHFMPKLELIVEHPDDLKKRGRIKLLKIKNAQGER